MLKLERLQTSAKPRAPLILQYNIPATMTWNQTALTTKFHHPPRHHPVATPVYSSYRYLSTKKPPASPTVWKTLRAPVLLGVGVYFGFMVFGKHQETKQGSAFFEALRYQNWGQGDVQEHDKREVERWKWVAVNRDVAPLNNRSELSNASGKTQKQNLEVLSQFLVRWRHSVTAPLVVNTTQLWFQHKIRRGWYATRRRSRGILLSERNGGWLNGVK